MRACVQRWLWSVVVLGMVGQSVAQPANVDTTGLAVAIGQAITAQMEEAGVPGSVATVVYKGKVFLNAGYGEVGLQDDRLIDPEHTLFDIGSVTKAFTAVAVLQQVEQGRLDLDTDVNHYLTAFPVPDTYAEPITLRHLLTHTAGFDDKNIGYVARNAEEGYSLGDYLERDLPPRVQPPGRVTGYSNHGFGLAGYLVEVVSGESYGDYVTRHILRPLGMTETLLQAPLPPEKIAQRAVGYIFDPLAGGVRSAPMAHRNLPPAGIISTTGADMARFMLALLDDGAYDGVRILSPESIALLQTPQFTHHPALTGFTLALMETPIGGIPSIEIRGGFLGSAAAMLLVPDYDLGVFVAANATRFRPFDAVREVVANRLPQVSIAKPAVPEPSADFMLRAKRYEGAYHITRYSRHSVEKIAIFDTPFFIEAQDNVLVVRSRRGAKLAELVEVEPLVFRNRSDSSTVVFLADDDGAITHFAQTLGNGFPAAFEKLTWRDDVRVQMPFMWVLLGVLASGFLLYPLALGGRRLVWRSSKTTGKRLGAGTAVGVVLQGLLGVGFMLVLSETLGNSGIRIQYVFGLPSAIQATFLLPYLSLGLIGWLGYRIVWMWQQQQGALLERVYVTLFVVVNAAYVWFLVNWNLLLWP